MGSMKPALPVKLFMGVITSIPEIVPEAKARLSELFGTVDLESESYPFDFTHYYDQEMGAPLRRCFFSFSELIDPSAIADIKIRTNDLEQKFALEHHAVKRPINLDPGYLENAKIVLASTKNYYHRILVSQGIYAEVTLHFEAGRWQSFPWTFPDFR